MGMIIFFLILENVQNLFQLRKLDAGLTFWKQVLNKTIDFSLDCIFSELDFNHHKDIVDIDFVLIHERQILLNITGCGLIKVNGKQILHDGCSF